MKPFNTLETFELFLMLLYFLYEFEIKIVLTLNKILLIVFKHIYLASKKKLLYN